MLGSGAVRVISGGAAVSVAARRFGPTDAALGTIGPARTAIVLARHDAAAVPWTLTLGGDTTVRACTLR